MELQEFPILQETLGCPVCYEVAIPPIFQCPKGHLICKDCINKIKPSVCPSCRSCLPSEKIRSLLAEKLAEILQFKCQNQENGCPISTKAKDMKAHLQNCEYREASWCLLFGSLCTERYLLPDFISHCQKLHAKHIHTKPLETWCTTQEITMRDVNDMTRRKLIWNPFLFQDMDENVFIFTSEFSPNRQTITWKLFVQNPKHDYNYETLKNWKFSAFVETEFGTIAKESRLDIHNEKKSPVISVGSFSVGTETLFSKRDLAEKLTLAFKIRFRLEKTGPETEKLNLKHLNLTTSKSTSLEEKETIPNYPHFPSALNGCIIPGRYELLWAQNYDEFEEAVVKGVSDLIFLGTPSESETNDSPEPPEIVVFEFLDRGDNMYTINVASSSTTFTLGETFKEAKFASLNIDATTVVTMDGNDKLVYIATLPAFEIKRIFAFCAEEMVVSYFINDVRATRVFKRV